MLTPSLARDERPLCDCHGCENRSVIAYADVELLPPGRSVPVKVGRLRLCTPHARRFVVEERVNVDWERLLPTL